ncbi:Ig-like domain-containing protein, partial [Buttiauxella warmboldiae]
TVQATIITTDAAGNTATASADHAVGVDVSAEATITIDSVVTEDVPQTDGPQGTVIHVNGGSASADGFDVLDGKIVKIGSNVHIWLSEGDTRPECADPDTQIKYYQDGNVRGDGPYTDVFVVHPGSQYERSGDGFRDNLNSINGTTQNDQSGHKDYIFLQDGTTSDYQHSSGTNNNSEHNVNTLESINITGTNDAGQTLNLQGVNRIEGIIYGDGSSYTANGDRTVITHSNTPAATEQYSFINGTVSGDAQVNDVVTLTINGHEYTGTVQLMGNGPLGYSISVNSADLAKGQLIHATITATDDVGNTVTVSAESSISDNNLVSTENIVAQQPASAGSVANVDANHSASEAAAIDKPAHVDKPHAAITLINGGSGTADGFDVQGGKIVAIGSNVRIWLSDGDKEPLCADSANQIKHYGKDNNNGNPQGDGTHADVFVVHQGSGYLQDGNHRGLDAINGTTQQVEGGHKDYIFLQDGAPSDYTCTAGTNNNAASNVNTLENIALTGTHNDAGQGLHLQGVNHIEGVIYGDGTAAITANETRTTFEHHDTPAVTHVSLMDALSASAVDDSSGHALSNLLESGDDIFHPAPSAAADNAAHQGNHLLSDAHDGLFILTADQHSDVVQSWQPDNQGSAVMGQVEQINLSDLTHELEHGTDIASLIKDTGQPATEPALVDTKAHVAVEPGGMDSMQHSSFDHLLHKPEHQY